MCAICNFKIEFGVGHPLALSVASATRVAIDRGLIDEAKTGGVLGTARQRLAAIDTLKVFQHRLETFVANDALLALPDFYVLLIESLTWGFFHATPDGFDPDIVPEMPDTTSDDVERRSVVVLAADVTMQALLTGAIALHQAIDLGLIAIDAPDVPHELLRRAIEQALVPAATSVSA